MTNIDELASDRHLNMSFLEFLEALARCADRFSLEKLGDMFPEFKSKHPTKLDKKLESICFKLIKMKVPENKYAELYKKYSKLIQIEVDGTLKYKKIKWIFSS